MPAQFVYIGRDYINLDRIDRVRLTDGGRWEIESEGHVLDRQNASFGEQLTSIIPCNGEWECLEPWRDSEDGNKATYNVQPVIAWGLLALGYLVPITPCDPNGVHNNYGLRREGRGEVYASQTTQAFASAEEWLKVALP